MLQMTQKDNALKGQLDGLLTNLFKASFKRILMIIGRATGPNFDKILEVPESIQKVLQYDRGP